MATTGAGAPRSDGVVPRGRGLQACIPHPATAVWGVPVDPAALQRIGGSTAVRSPDGMPRAIRPPESPNDRP